MGNRVRPVDQEPREHEEDRHADVTDRGRSRQPAGAGMTRPVETGERRRMEHDDQSDRETSECVEAAEVIGCRCGSARVGVRARWIGGVHGRHG